MFSTKPDRTDLIRCYLKLHRIRLFSPGICADPKGPTVCAELSRRSGLQDSAANVFEARQRSISGTL